MRLAAVLVSWVLGLLGATSVGSFGYAACFRQDANSRLKFQVFQQAPPPANNEQKNYRFFPLSGSSSMNVPLLNSSQASSDKYWFQWANRCQPMADSSERCGWNPKGNIVSPRLVFNGEDKRLFFSTMQKANLCTLIQASFVLNVPYDEPAAKANGLRVVQYDNAEPALTNGRFVDACVVPPERFNPNIQGIILDYEVQDGRSPEATRQFLSDYASLVRRSGRKVGLLSNPLDAPTQKYTGINEVNAGDLMLQFDLFGVMLWGGNRQKDIATSFQSQIKMLEKTQQVDPKRIMIVYDIGKTKLDDAKVVHQIMVTKKFPSLMIWRNGETLGEDDCDNEANRRLSCVVFGSCQ